MAKKIWESEAVSIIVLPSGDQGREILELAQEWSRSWLLTPARKSSAASDLKPQRSLTQKHPRGRPRPGAHLNPLTPRPKGSPLDT